MWVHIVIFIIAGGLALGWKKGWIPTRGLETAQGRRLFVLVALAGNIVGMALTLKNGGGQTYQEGYQMKKEEGVSYEEKFEVSVDGESAGSVYIQVPEKESEEEELQQDVMEEEEVSESQKLQEAVAAYNEEKNDPDYYYLPGEWEGSALVWGTERDTTGAMLSALFLAAGVGVLISKARESQAAIQKRREELLQDYPGLILKFTLLVQAGMTVRRTFRKMALDYKRKNPEKKRAAYEEILVTCYEMDSGVSEVEAYHRFGERCDQIKYKTFAALLCQNLQKGSKSLAEMLERESLEAWEERKRKARVLGETAATKLLIPMFLMLAVVMAVIMIPAFLSFYG